MKKTLWIVYMIVFFFHFSSELFAGKDVCRELSLPDNSQIRARGSQTLEDHFLKVLWWNIEHGGRDPVCIYKNISELLEKPSAPDLIVLAEAQQNSFFHIFKKVIAKLGYTVQFFSYQNQDSRYQEGIAVFFRTTIRVIDIQDVFLPWHYGLNPDQQAISAHAWRNNCERAGLPRDTVETWSRHSPRIAIEKSGFQVRINPMHLAQPWDCASAAGMGLTGLSMLNNPLNPPGSQIKKMIDEGKKDTFPQVFFGDFNLPSEYLSIRPSALRQFENDGLISGFLNKKDDLYSWPVPQTHSGPALRIDHVFHTKTLYTELATILNWRGSDHFPLFFSIGSLP